MTILRADGARKEAKIARDIRLLGRACQILLSLAGLEGEVLWTVQGPSKRASWMKGYLRRGPASGERRGLGELGGGASSSPARVRAPAIEALSHRERTMLLVAFDLWNGSGDASFRDVVGLSPRLVTAIAGLMAARCAELAQGRGLQAWIGEWGGDARGG